NRAIGVPYSEEMIAKALEDLQIQATTEPDDPEGLEARYAKVNIRDFDGNPAAVTEMDALVAYLQVLGTMVDFNSFKADNAALR
ncbi:MAG: cbb3-type cytochrome c oxidase subunit II, partial [Pseudomonadota bacterium]